MTIPIHSNLKGRVAVITGGSGVLCSAMALELARQGMKIAVLNLNPDKGNKVVQDIEAIGGEALFVSTNVLSKPSLEQACEQIIERFQHIHLLINGAGGNHSSATTHDEYYDEASEQSFFDLSEEGIQSVFSLNFTGTFLASQVFAKPLLKAEQPSIINISSMSGFTPLTKIPAYSAAKSSINNFTEWLATYFAKSNLRVNAIAPGFFATTQNKQLLYNEDGSLSARSKKIIQATPMEQFGEPQHLLGALLFLADPAYSAFVTGITIPVDGGFNSYSGV